MEMNERDGSTTSTTANSGNANNIEGREGEENTTTMSGALSTTGDGGAAAGVNEGPEGEASATETASELGSEVGVGLRQSDLRRWLLNP